MCQRRQYSAMDLEKIGPLKVLRQPDPQDLAQAAHDVHIAGEVGVNLGRVAQSPQENRDADIAVIVGKQLLHVAGEDIRHNHLLEEAPDHALRPEGEAVIARAVGGEELTGEIVPGGNRALGDLWEEGGEEQQLHGVPLRPGLAPVDVAEVAQGLEGVEGDAQRDDPADAVGNLSAEKPGQSVGLGQQEMHVLEGAEHPDIQQHAEHHHPAAALLAPGLPGAAFLLAEIRLVGREKGLLGVGVLLDVLRCPPGGKGRQQQPGQIQQAAQGVEAQTEGQQHPPLGPLRHQKIQHAEPQYKEQEGDRKDTHSKTFLGLNAVAD